MIAMQVVNEIADMDRALSLLKKAILAKEDPMKLAQTRLEERTRRLQVELCNDPVMKGYIFHFYFYDSIYYR